MGKEGGLYHTHWDRHNMIYSREFDEFLYISNFTFCNTWSWDIGLQNLVLFYSCCFKSKYIIYVTFCYIKISIDEVLFQIDNGNVNGYP